MAFEVIDKKLRIYSCSIGDLTVDQAVSMLALWEKGAQISSLTCFYDASRCGIVLNRDNRDFDMYCKMAKAYLGADEKKRNRLDKKLHGFSNKSVLEVLQVFKHALSHREIDMELFILRNFDFDEAGFYMHPEIRKRIKEKNKGDVNFGMDSCILEGYEYGFIQGKRAERARRKRRAKE